MHLIQVVLSQAITTTSDSWMDEERKTEVLDRLDWHEEEVVHLQNIWNEQIPNLIVLTSLTCNITINKMVRMKYCTQYNLIFVVSNRHTEPISLQNNFSKRYDRNNIFSCMKLTSIFAFKKLLCFTSHLLREKVIDDSPHPI